MIEVVEMHYMYMSVCTPELVSQVISGGSMLPDPPGGADIL